VGSLIKNYRHLAYYVFTHAMMVYFTLIANVS